VASGVGFGLLILVLAWAWSRDFYATHLVPDDGVGSYYWVAEALSTTEAEGRLASLRLVSRGEMYVLYQMMAALLGELLPRNMGVGVFLNAPLYLAAAVALVRLFAQRAFALGWSIAFSVPLLLEPSFIPSTDRGLTNLHQDLPSYLLSITVAACFLGSRGLRSPLGAVGAGLAFGLLILARFPTAVLLGCWLAPLVAWQLLRDGRDRAAWRGLLLGTATALVVAAWWLIPRLGFFAHFVGFWYGRPRATIGTLGLASVPTLIKGYVKLLLAADLVYAAVLCLLVFAGLRAAIRSAGQAVVNAAALWLAVCPLLMLLALRSNNALYGLPAVVGCYLAVALPAASAVGRRAVGLGIRLALAAGVTALVATALLKGWRSHSAPSDEKAAAAAVLREVLASSGPPRLAVAYWGALNAYALADLAAFELGARVTIDDTLPVEPRFPSPVLRIRRAVLWSHGPDPSGVQQLVREVRGWSYVLVLDPACGPRPDPMPFPGEAPNWYRLSEILLASGEYVAVQTQLRPRGNECATLLRRREAPGGS
jgi:hypothetical protein